LGAAEHIDEPAIRKRALRKTEVIFMKPKKRGIYEESK
tara:strand:- start:372 stop:485 length:114 start_codon:yes stop_codon:yes gene_type:complete